jgi:hypothetical protein
MADDGTALYDFSFLRIKCDSAHKPLVKGLETQQMFN